MTLIQRLTTMLTLIALIFVSFGIGYHEYDTFFWLAAGWLVLLAIPVADVTGFLKQRNLSRRRRAGVKELNRDIRRHQLADTDYREDHRR